MDHHIVRLCKLSVTKLADKSFLWFRSSSLAQVKSGVIGRGGGGKQGVLAKHVMEELGMLQGREGERRGGEGEVMRRRC